LCESAEKTKEILRTGEPIILSLAKLPVLVSTSLDPKTWYDAADCLGISGHVVKPLNAQELLECVGFVLDSVGSEPAFSYPCNVALPRTENPAGRNGSYETGAV
jgi:hypothetical protein